MPARRASAGIAGLCRTSTDRRKLSVCSIMRPSVRESATPGPAVQETADCADFADSIRFAGMLISSVMACQALQNLTATLDTECTDLDPSLARNRFHLRLSVHFSVYSVSVLFRGCRFLVSQPEPEPSAQLSRRSRPPILRRAEPANQQTSQQASKAETPSDSTRASRAPACRRPPDPCAGVRSW